MVPARTLTAISETARATGGDQGPTPRGSQGLVGEGAVNPAPTSPSPQPRKVLYWRFPDGRRGKTAAMPAETVEADLRDAEQRGGPIAFWSVDVLSKES
jgi:hypothetical protein